jgi:hypothetical protein
MAAAARSSNRIRRKEPLAVAGGDLRSHARGQAASQPAMVSPVAGPVIVAPRVRADDKPAREREEQPQVTIDGQRDDSPHPGRLVARIVATPSLDPSRAEVLHRIPQDSSAPTTFGRPGTVIVRRGFRQRHELRQRIPPYWGALRERFGTRRCAKAARRPLQRLPSRLEKTACEGFPSLRIAL